jgi:hypothetical protein
MVLAAQTTASPAAIWTIVVVMVACLVFWLGAVVLADRHPYVRHPQIPEMPGPVLGGTHLAEGGRSVSPDRDAPAVFTEAEVTELTSPVVAGQERAGRPQQTGEGDRAKPSVAGPGTANDG